MRTNRLRRTCFIVNDKCFPRIYGYCENTYNACFIVGTALIRPDDKIIWAYHQKDRIHTRPNYTEHH